MDAAAHKKKGINLFVLGLLGITVCNFLAPVAWYLGILYVRGCQVEGVQPDSYGVIGRVLGMVGTILLVMSIATILAVVALEVLVFVVLI